MTGWSKGGTKNTKVASAAAVAARLWLWQPRCETSVSSVQHILFVGIWWKQRCATKDGRGGDQYYKGSSKLQEGESMPTGDWQCS